MKFNENPVSETRLIDAENDPGYSEYGANPPSEWYKQIVPLLQSSGNAVAFLDCINSYQRARDLCKQHYWNKATINWETDDGSEGNVYEKVPKFSRQASVYVCTIVMRAGKLLWNNFELTDYELVDELLRNPVIHNMLLYPATSPNSIHFQREKKTLRFGTETGATQESQPCMSKQNRPPRKARFCLEYLVQLEKAKKRPEKPLADILLSALDNNQLHWLFELLADFRRTQAAWHDRVNESDEEKIPGSPELNRLERRLSNWLFANGIGRKIPKEYHPQMEPKELLYKALLYRALLQRNFPPLKAYEPITPRPANEECS